MFNDLRPLGDLPYNRVDQDYVLEYIWTAPSGGQQSGQQDLQGTYSQAQHNLETGHQQAQQSLNTLHQQAQQRIRRSSSPEEAQHHLATYHQQAQQHVQAQHQNAQHQLHTLHAHAQQESQGQQQQPRELSDDDIQKLVNDALDHNPMTAHADINAVVKNHEVNLTGTARTPQIKRIADSLTWNCPGVINVNNNITIEGRAQQSQGQQSGQTARSGSASGA